MGFAKKMRKLLWRIVDDICSERRKYFVSAGKDFTRKGKIKPQDIFKALFVMEDKALSKELLPYFDFDLDAPTTSAFVQARAKIRPEAFEDLFDIFVSKTTDSKEKYLYKGYRLLLLTAPILMFLPTRRTPIRTFQIQMASTIICITSTPCMTCFGKHTPMS